MQNNLQHLYGASSYLIGSENKLENLEHSLFNIDLKLSCYFLRKKMLRLRNLWESSQYI